MGQSDTLLAMLESISIGYNKYCLHFSNNQDVYYKHLTHFELLKIRKDYDNNLNIAISNGILREEDQIKIAYDNGWWSKSKESDLTATNLSIERLKKTKSKLIYESDKSRIEEQIISQEARAKKLSEEKNAYIVMTAEEWAGRKTVDCFLQNFIYKDDKLLYKLFDKSVEFELADDVLINELTIYYYKFLMEFSDKKIKQLAISPFFQNLIYISNGTSRDIFDIPAIKMTKNQSDLLLFSKYYQNIIKNSNSDLPDIIYEDPDKIIEWAESLKKNNDSFSQISKNKFKNKNASDNSSSFLFGNREEVKLMSGGDVSGDRIIQETQSKGNLGIYDLLKK